VGYKDERHAAVVVRPPNSEMTELCRHSIMSLVTRHLGAHGDVVVCIVVERAPSGLGHERL
jgi:hypothetical protein